MRGIVRKLGVVLGGVAVMVVAGQTPAHAAPSEIKSAASGKCWDIRGESNVDGAVVQLYSCKSGSVWQTFGVGTGSITTGYLKCVTAQSANNDAQILQRTCGPVALQSWDKYQTGTNWTFAVRGTNLCITDTGISGGGRRVELRLRTCDGSLSQQFRVPGI